MQKTKRTLTGILVGFLSAFLAVVMAVGVAYIPNITANAAIITVETITEGETWKGSWSSLESYKTVKLVAEKTAFYDFTFTDHKQNGILLIEIEDVVSGNSAYYNEFIGSHEYVCENVFLAADVEYEIYIGYFDGSEGSTDYVPMDGKVSVEFNKNNFTPYKLTNCEPDDSDVTVQVDGTEEWFAYTTTQAGDYSFNYSPNYADIRLQVYSANTGEFIGNYYSEIYVYEWETYEYRDRIVLNLDANTTYYINFFGYDIGDRYKLSMTKNAKTVQKIAAYESMYSPYNPFWDAEDIERSDFSYKITYTDGSSEIMDYFYQVIYAGYELPTVEFKGPQKYINGEYLLQAGRQPVESTYNDITTTIYVEVTSLYDHWENADVIGVGEDNQMKISASVYEAETFYWNINVPQNGVYATYRYSSDDFATNFASYEISIVDYYHNEIPFDATLHGWPLEANKPYKLIFSYEYKSDYTWNDIYFWLQKEADLKSGWYKENNLWYFYENGTLVKNQWRKDSIGWVYLGKNGAMLTNTWCTDSKGWCYVGANGYAVTNCWKRDSHGWIWLDANGSMTKSKWILDGGKWYYLDENGYMVSNQWRKDSIGWVYIGADGAMLTNAWCTDSKGWCYVGADGYAVTNCWKRDSHGWIWLDANGSMTKNKWVLDGGKWYYLDSNGYMLANTSRHIGSKLYYFNGSGICTNP